MFSWLIGNKNNFKTVNFENIQLLKNNVFLINTLDEGNQKCLIKGTISIKDEVKVINDNMENRECNIIVYGKHTNDNTVLKKYNQLKKLGFYNVYIYFGGMFEWLCLRDIYGEDMFPTVGEEFDILRFKPDSDMLS